MDVFQLFWFVVWFLVCFSTYLLNVLPPCVSFFHMGFINLVFFNTSGVLYPFWWIIVFLELFSGPSVFQLFNSVLEFWCVFLILVSFCKSGEFHYFRCVLCCFLLVLWYYIIETERFLVVWNILIIAISFDHRQSYNILPLCHCFIWYSLAKTTLMEASACWCISVIEA